MEGFETHKGRKPYLDYRNFDFTKEFTGEDVELWLSCGIDDRKNKPKYHIKTKVEMQEIPFISIA